jgi:hypothetical protein
MDQNQATASTEEFWFPGRWVGGFSLILAPLLLLAGIIARINFHFFFPQQLEAFQDHPSLITASYNLFAVGNILLFPAILTLVRMIGKTKRQWALWSGMFVILGLFARTFHAGIDHLAFQLVDISGLEQATDMVAESYGAFNVLATLNGTILFGWIILAIGSYLSGTLGLFRSLALGLVAGLMLGVLKGSSWYSMVAATGLCIALLPLGLKVLKDGPMPSLKQGAAWAIGIVVLVAALYIFGQLG